MEVMERGRLVGSEVEEASLPLSLRSAVFVAASAQSFNARLMCWSAVCRGHMLKVSHFVC